MAAPAKEKKGNILLKLTAVGLVLYGLVFVMQTQVEVTAKRRELEGLQAAVKEQTLRNEELTHLLGEGNELDYIARIARDKLGYAYANERIYVDVSGS